ncbi:MAG: methyltransferase, partial [Alphaproteobacteria bacterium]|nr:methyltransferase [Alphaproteobacteria bacterium]
GSLRLFAGHAGAHPVSQSVARLVAREAAAGVGDPATYRRFGEQVRACRDHLAAYLRGLRGGGRTVAAYGASAKGTTLLNYCAVGADLIDFVADLSPLKQGRCMPGVGIPIVGPEQLAHRRPDFVVLLAWNLADEIARQQAAYLRQGGRFVVPIPEPHLLSDGG